MSRFFYLYIVLGAIALLIFIWQLADSHWTGGGLVLNGILVILFFYLAYKVYHEKKNKEMM